LSRPTATRNHPVWSPCTRTARPSTTEGTRRPWPSSFRGHRALDSAEAGPHRARGRTGFSGPPPQARRHRQTDRRTRRSRRGRQVDGRRDDLAVSRSLRCRQSAQIFLSTAQGMVRLADGTQRMIRIPDAMLRIRPGRHEACCMRSMRWPTSGTLCSGRSLERPRRDRATGGRTRSSPGRAC
jgi:hypothetical protein